MSNQNVPSYWVIDETGAGRCLAWDRGFRTYDEADAKAKTMLPGIPHHFTKFLIGRWQQGVWTNFYELRA